MTITEPRPTLPELPVVPAPLAIEPPPTPLPERDPGKTVEIWTGGGDLAVSSAVAPIDGGIDPADAMRSAQRRLAVGAALAQHTTLAALVRAQVPFKDNVRDMDTMDIPVVEATEGGMVPPHLIAAAHAAADANLIAAAKGAQQLIDPTTTGDLPAFRETNEAVRIDPAAPLKGVVGIEDTHTAPSQAEPLPQRAEQPQSDSSDGGEAQSKIELDYKYYIDHPEEATDLVDRLVLAHFNAGRSPVGITSRRDTFVVRIQGLAEQSATRFANLPPDATDEDVARIVAAGKGGKTYDHGDATEQSAFLARLRDGLDRHL